MQKYYPQKNTDKHGFLKPILFPSICVHLCSSVDKHLFHIANR